MKAHEVFEAVGIGIMLAGATVIEITLIPFVAGVCIAFAGLGGEHYEKKKNDRARAERNHRRNMRIDFRVGA